MSNAFVVIDFINEIVSDRGKLSGKGYAAYIAEHDTFAKLNEAITKFRKAGAPVIFVRLGFDPSYSNQPKGSPVFGRAHEFGILAKGTWSTEIHEAVNVEVDDQNIVKDRVSAFHGTGLAESLRAKGITDVYFAGVATDLAVEAAARSAHDYDFNVHIVEDACAAANEEDHAKTLYFAPKIAKVVAVADLNL